jgi:hypothetical protein
MKIVIGIFVAGPVLIWWLRARDISREGTTAIAVIGALALAELVTDFSTLVTPPPALASLIVVGIAIGFLKGLIVGLALVLWLQFNRYTREGLIAGTNGYIDQSVTKGRVFNNGLKRMATEFQAPRFHPSQLFTIFMLAILSSMVILALRWDFSAKIVPLVIGSVGITVCLLSLLNDMCRKPTVQMESLAESAQHQVEQKIHMDLASDTEHLPIDIIIKRAYRFFGYLVTFMGVMYVIGLVPTVGLFVIFFMRYENREPWRLVITYAMVLVFSITFVFDNVMSIPWPQTLMAQWFPILKFLPSI